MSPHVRAVSFLWTGVGIALGAWAVWGLITEEHWRSVVISWLILLGFALLAVVAGVTFGTTGLLGRVLIRVVSSLALLYSAAWLLLGGLDDAPGYWPAIVVAVALAIYAFAIARRQARAA